MNQVSIRRGKLEVSKLALSQPVSTIGRSPVCDGILRAPGIQPVHFLLEWQGSGDFGRDGTWVIFDVSSLEKSTQESADGRVLGRDEVEFRGFHFRLNSDSLASAEKIGGAIRKSLAQSSSANHQVLEILRMRQGSGAIEQVFHIDSSKKWKKSRVFKDIPELNLAISSQEKEAKLSLLKTSQDLGGVQLYKGSQRVAFDGDISIQKADLIRLDWRDFQIFFRWVDRPQVVAAERRVFDSRLLRTLLLAGLLISLPIAVWIVQLSQRVEPVLPTQPPRMATVEIKEAPPPPPLSEVRPPTEKVEQQKAMDISVSSKTQAAAAKPRFQSEQSKPRAGLNAPVAPTDVNRVGLLGSLRKTTGQAGPGVRADQIFNDGIVTDSVSSKSDGGVLLKNPPAGALGTGNSGDARGGKNTELGSLSTTLSGKDFDPKSSGPIARPGGKADYTVGTGMGKLGVGGAGGSGGELGSVSDGSLSVRGGLDRETVRRVIIAQRGQIQICYERALLSKPKILGLLLVRFDITPSGQVSSARLEKSEVGSPQLESCVLGVMKALVFPVAPNGVATQVIYPWQFQAKS